MTAKDIASAFNMEIAAGNGGIDNEITEVYCCDLLSFAMSKAPEGSAWLTVMNNVNVVAVASLADVACIIMAEGALPDASAIAKANEHSIPILTTKEPAFHIGRQIYDKMPNS